MAEIIVTNDTGVEAVVETSPSTEFVVEGALKGAPGIQGPQGEPGAQGEQGEPGPPGSARYINIQDYGALGNGIGDDSQAIRNAIDAAVAIGWPLYIPGTLQHYPIGSTIEITESLFIIGDGENSHIKAGDGLSGWIFVVNPVDEDVRIIISDIKIDGNIGAATASGIQVNGAVEGQYTGLHFINCFDWGLELGGFESLAFGHHNRVLNCLFDSTLPNTGLGGGIRMTSSDENLIIGSNFQFLGGSGTANPACILDQAGLQIIQNCVFVGSRGGNTNVRGIHLDSGNRSYIGGCTFDGVGGDNIFVKGQMHQIIGCRFTYPGDQGIGYHSGIHFEFGATENTVTGCQFDAADAGANGTRSYIRESDGDPGNNTIVGCAFNEVGVLNVGPLELRTGPEPVTQVMACTPASLNNTGAGIVEAVVEGAGINVDATDPTAPIVAVEAALTTKLGFITVTQAVDLDTMESDIALKAPLASPALTGNPTAPTQANGDNSTKIATTAYVDALIAAQDAMVFKGVIDASANPNYPAADRGHTYRISVAGKIGGASGPNVEVGDLIICLTDGTAAGTQAAVGANWSIAQTNIDGAVVGPASVTDDLPAIFDGTTGKLIKSKTYAAFKTLLALVKGDVGLGNVDNTSNATERAAVRTLTNARITKREGTVASSATPTINTDDVDLYTITALAAAITSMTTNLSGTPTDGQELWIRIKDNGTARAITWGASFVSSGVATLLATTVISKTHWIKFIYDADAAKWVCIAVDATGY